MPACPRPLWPLPLARSMFLAATEAWDRRAMAHTTAVRTVSIPTGDVATLAFGLGPRDRAELYEGGRRAGRAFFAGHREYVNSFGQRAGGLTSA